MEGKGNLLYERRDWFLALASCVAAYGYVSGISELFYWGDSWISGWLLFVVAFVLVYSKSRKIVMTKESWVYCLMVCLGAGWFLNLSWRADYMDGFISLWLCMFLFVHGVFIYWILVLNGNRFRNETGERLLLDLARGTLGLPLSHFHCLFQMVGKFVLTWNRKLWGMKEGNPSVKKIWLGIVISIPVLFLILPLLLQADPFFAQSVDWIGEGLAEGFHWLFYQVGFRKMLVSLLLSGYLFGLFYGSAHTYRKAEHTEISLAEPLKMDHLSLTTFLCIIDGVYLLFFVIRFVGAVSALAQSKAGQLVYSAYAREGFFQLCLIVVINFLIFSAVKMLSAEQSGSIETVMALLGIETLGFITLAFSKMALYISVYGFTFLRVFTSWFMIVCFLTFGLQIAGLKRKQLKVVKISMMFAGITFLLLSYSNMGWWMEAMNQRLL